MALGSILDRFWIDFGGQDGSKIDQKSDKKLIEKVMPKTKPIKERRPCGKERPPCENPGSWSLKTIQQTNLPEHRATPEAL